MNHCVLQRKGETTDFALVQSSMTPSGLPYVNETTGSRPFQVCLTRVDVPPCPASADRLGGTLVCRTKVARVKAWLPQPVHCKATELIRPVTVQFSNCEGCDRRVLLLPDDGCEASALAPFDFFLVGTLIPARHPLNIVAIDGSNIRAGRQGAVMDITVPAQNSSGLEELIHCQRAFVYAAYVRGGLVIGYPFFKAYGLCVDPVADCLRDCLSQSPSASPAISELVQDNSDKQGDVQCACVAHSALHSVSGSDPGVLLDDLLQIFFLGDALGVFAFAPSQSILPVVTPLLSMSAYGFG